MKKTHSSTIQFCLVVLLCTMLAFGPTAAYAGTAVGTAINVVVDDEVVITLQPVSQTIVPGDPVTFTVAATGTPNVPPGVLTYQWQFNGVAIPGATTTSYTIASVAPANGGAYTCVVTGLVGPVTSNQAILTVGNQLNISIACNPVPTPGTVAVNPNATLTFTGTATGGYPAYTYQWRHDGLNIAGATSSVFTLGPLSAAMNGAYDCIVTDSHAATAPSNAITVTVNTGVTITQHPTSQAAVTGQTVQFSVAATGTPALTYQWQKDGANIGGATNSTLTLANVQPSDGGQYRCVVTNVVGSVNSNYATLTVNNVLTVSVTSQPVAVLEAGNWVVHVLPPPPGTNIVFNVVATGGVPPYSYQWTRNGVNIAGQTGTSFTILNANDADEGAINCTVTDSGAK